MELTAAVETGIARQLLGPCYFVRRVLLVGMACVRLIRRAQRRWLLPAILAPRAY